MWLLHKLLGCTQLVTQVAQQLLTLLQQIEIEHTYLQLAIVLDTLQTVYLAMTILREFVLELVGSGKGITIAVETAGGNTL